MMTAAILFPRFDHQAIEERYASWQSEMLLRRQTSDLQHYDFDETAWHALLDVDDPHVLVVTDPLVLPTPGLVDGLVDALQTSGTSAAIPVTNESTNAAQRASMP